jgi:hypothetical protein
MKPLLWTSSSKRTVRRRQVPGAPPEGRRRRFLQITCTKDLWERTKPGHINTDSHQDAESHSRNDAAGERGLVGITRTGAQLVDHIKTLEEDISGGPFADESVGELSRRMYEAIAQAGRHLQEGMH